MAYIGERGEGTVFQRGDGRWMASVTVRGKRRYRYGKSREVAVARLQALVKNSRRGLTDGLRAKTRRERAEKYAIRILEHAAAEGWSFEHTALVLVSQMAPSRIKRDVFGPCSYCGTWAANTVDHVHARSQGGSDDRANLTSACWSCNSRKGKRAAALMSVSLAANVAEGT